MQSINWGTRRVVAAATFHRFTTPTALRRISWHKLLSILVPSPRALSTTTNEKATSEGLRGALRKAVGAACILSISDTVAQVVIQTRRQQDEEKENRRKHFVLDTGRNASFAIWGFVWGPIIHCWLSILNALVPGKSALPVATKITIDQLTMCPLAHISVFTLTKTLQQIIALGDEGKDAGCSATIAARVSSIFEDCFWEAQDKARISVATGWTLWPIVHTVTFAVIPLHVQGMFAMLASATFNVVLSFFAFDFKPTEDSEDAGKRYFDLFEQLANQPAFVAIAVNKISSHFAGIDDAEVTGLRVCTTSSSCRTSSASSHIQSLHRMENHENTPMVRADQQEQ